MRMVISIRRDSVRPNIDVLPPYNVTYVEGVRDS